MHFEVPNLPHFIFWCTAIHQIPNHCSTCTLDSTTVRLFVNVGEAVDPFLEAEYKSYDSLAE